MRQPHKTGCPLSEEDVITTFVSRKFFSGFYMSYFFHVSVTLFKEIELDIIIRGLKMIELN